MQIFQASEDGTRNIFLLPESDNVDTPGWNLVLTDKTTKTKVKDSQGRLPGSTGYVETWETAVPAKGDYQIENVFNTSDLSQKVAKDGEIFKMHDALDWKGIGDQVDNYLKENDATLSQTHPNLYSTPPVYKKTRTGGTKQMVGGVIDKAELKLLLQGAEFQDYFEDITSEDAAAGQWYGMGSVGTTSTPVSITDYWDSGGNILPAGTLASDPRVSKVETTKYRNQLKGQAAGQRVEGEVWDRTLEDYDPAVYKTQLIDKIATKYF